jgi:hypothetical protein
MWTEEVKEEEDLASGHVSVRIILSLARTTLMAKNKQRLE